MRVIIQIGVITVLLPFDAGHERFEIDEPSFESTYKMIRSMKLVIVISSC